MPSRDWPYQDRCDWRTVQLWPSRTVDLHLTLDSGQLWAEIILSGDASPVSGDHRVVCGLERKLTNEDFLPDHFPNRLQPSIAIDRSPQPSIGADDGVWEPVSVVDHASSRRFKVEMERTPGDKWQTRLCIAPDPSWPEPVALRLTISEAEVYFCTHELPEGESKSYRPTFFECVQIPDSALRALGLRVATQ